MKLIIRQKRFTFKDRFRIEDQDGNDRYEVTGELIEASKKLHIKDMDGNEVAMIKEKMISFRPKFYLYINDELVGEIVKEYTFFKARYHITGLDWKIKGDIQKLNYEIIEDDRKIAEVRKKFFAMSDTYLLEIDDDNNEIADLAAVLAIDYIVEKERRKKKEQRDSTEE